MNSLFKPKVVAVVGASHDPTKAGHILFYNLKRSFRGKVYPVNLKGGEILGTPVYKSLSDLPESPDLVFVAIPSPSVPSVVREAIRVGAKAIVVVSGGFGEVGREDLDEELRNALLGERAILIGPNCIGIYTPELNGTFLSGDRMDFPGKGGVSIISQSGAIVAAMLDLFAREEIGVSKVVSLGNKLLIDEVDLLEYLLEDPETEIIVLYLEGVRRGREFFELVKKTTVRKPVIVLKGGKTSTGSRAAASHTEAIVNDYEVFRGAMRQAGAIEVDTIEEMGDVILALKQPIPRGKNLLIVTNGGGFGVIASDFANRYGFNLPDWEEPLPLPPHIVQSNPFDLTGDARPEWYSMVLGSARGYDLAVVIITPQTPAIDPSIARLLRTSTIPVYAFVPGWRYADYIREKLIDAGIPVYEDLEGLFRAISRLSDYGKRFGYS